GDEIRLSDCHGAELQRQYRSTVFCVHGSDGCPVAVGDLLDDGEAEPGAGHAPGTGRAVKAVEDVRDVGRIDALPVVAHHHRPAFDGDLDRRAGGAPLGSVVDQVRHRSADPLRRTSDQKGGAVHLYFGGRMVTSGNLGNLAGQLVEVDQGLQFVLAVTARQL